MDLDFYGNQMNGRGLSKQEQQQHLFLKQKGILDTFLARRVISQEQYDLSLRTLVDHMVINPTIWKKTALPYGRAASYMLFPLFV